MSWFLKKRIYCWPATDKDAKTIVASVDAAISLMERRLAFSKYQLVVAAAAATYLALNASAFGRALEVFDLNERAIIALSGSLMPFWALGIGGSLISIWAVEHNLSKAESIKYAIASGDKEEFQRKAYLFGGSWTAFWMGDSLAKTNLIQALGMVALFVMQMKGTIIESGLGLR